MNVDYINGAKTNRMFGYKRIQDELHNRLNKNIKLNRIEYAPSKNILMQIFNLLIKYPTIVFSKTKKNNLKHLTSPDVSYLLNFFRFKKTMVSCYDLISYHRIKDYTKLRRILIRMNYKGMVKANHILTISDYSKKDIIETLKYPANKISVIYPCVDLKKYNPRPDKAILKKHNLTNEKILLYVGSEEPRQNVDKIIKALKILTKKHPDLIFIKVGLPQWPGGREHLIDLINKNKLQNKVIFAEHIGEELPKYYNAADVFVYPCAYAGWGLPPMEAAACGIPVVVSNKTSLPEAVGEGGLYIDPEDHVALAKNIDLLLTNNAVRDEKIRAGLKHVNKFSWSKGAKKLENIYKKVNSIEK